MKNGRSILLIAQLVVMLILLVFVSISGIRFKADLLSMLPNTEYPNAVAHAESKLFSQAANRIMLSFSGDAKAQAYDDMLEGIQKYGWQAQLPESQQIERLAAFYSQFSGALLSEGYKREIASPASFEQYFLHQLSQVSSPWISKTINTDPSLATASYLEHILSVQAALILENGRLVAANSPEKPLVLFIALNAEPKDSQGVNFSIKTANELSSLTNMLAAKYASVKIDASGMVLHTAENAANAKWEMNVFGGLSLTLTLLIVIWAFRSLAPVLWLSFTIANAFVFGFCIVAVTFDAVHFITLVFGVTLIGVGVDYCLHVLTNRYAKDKISVGKTIFFAFITTFLCYSLLFFTPLLILKQVAVFVSAGLFAAFVASFWIEKTSSLSWVNRGIRPRNCEKLLKLLTQTPRLNVAFGGLILILFIVKTPVFDDNIAMLNASSTSLTEAQSYHHQLLGQQGKIRVFLYEQSLQSLLKNEEDLADKLTREFSNIELVKLSDWIPSTRNQVANRQLQQHAYHSDVYGPLLQLSPNFKLAANNDLVTLNNFVAANGSDYIARYYVDVEPFYVSVLEIGNISLSQLRPIVENTHNAVIFDKQSALTEVLKSFRKQMTYWLLGAIALISILLWARFDWSTMLKSLFVIVVSISGALVASSLYQHSLNIFNLLSAILLMGLAVDYLIFHREHPKTNANILAITLSALSSLLVFGMLAFSQTPAIYSFGITVTAGLILIYLLAPLVIKEENEQRSI